MEAQAVELQVAYAHRVPLLAALNARGKSLILVGSRWGVCDRLAGVLWQG